MKSVSRLEKEKKKMNKKSDFDNFAENYREIHTKNVQGVSGVDSGYFGRQKIEIIQKEWGGVKNRSGKARILDLGCGDGMNAVHFQQYFMRMEYYGIDISSASIMQAKKLQGLNVHFECYDGKKIPFEDQNFDIILVACVLHHVPHGEHEKLLSECNRVLKENGCIYIFEHNPVNPVTRKLVSDCEFDRDAVLVRRGRLVSRMKRAGFHNIKVSYIIFFPRKGFFKRALGAEKLLRWLPLGGQYYVSGQK